MVQALEAKPTGCGSYPVDIIKDNFCADIKMLSFNGNKTGETSLAQKFTEPDLDSLFNNSKYQEICDMWKLILDEKYRKVKKNHNEIKHFYFFIFLRSFEKIFLSCFKLDLDKISRMEPDDTKSNETSIFIKNGIDDKFGQIKIYKPKKRMELRLLHKNLLREEYLKEIFSNYEYFQANSKQNILQLIKENKNKRIYQRTSKEYF